MHILADYWQDHDKFLESYARTCTEYNESMYIDSEIRDNYAYVYGGLKRICIRYPFSSTKTTIMKE